MAFGCGATVYYNYRDFRFENCLRKPVLVAMTVDGRSLVGTISTDADPGFRVRIEERGHRFFNDSGRRYRENRVYRMITDADGKLLSEELLAHNRGEVLY